MNDLCRIAEKYGTDKHNPVSFPPEGDLTSYYHALFSERRNDVRKVLEIGIGTKACMWRPKGGEYTPGASLFMWEEYFPNAEIYALDIEPAVLINRGRIHSFLCDQSRFSSLLGAADKIGFDCDLIIDDGSHIPEHQIATARILVPLLVTDGVYVIEDILSLNRTFVQQSVPYTSELVEIVDRNGGVGNNLLQVWGN